MRTRERCLDHLACRTTNHPDIHRTPSIAAAPSASIGWVQTIMAALAHAATMRRVERGPSIRGLSAWRLSGRETFPEIGSTVTTAARRDRMIERFPIIEVRPARREGTVSDATV